MQKTHETRLVRQKNSVKHEPFATFVFGQHLFGSISGTSRGMERTVSDVGTSSEPPQHVDALAQESKRGESARLGKGKNSHGLEILALHQRAAGRLRGRTETRPGSQQQLLRRGGDSSLLEARREPDSRADLVLRTEWFQSCQQRNGRLAVRCQGGGRGHLFRQIVARGRLWCLWRD